MTVTSLDISQNYKHGENAYSLDISQNYKHFHRALLHRDP